MLFLNKPDDFSPTCEMAMCILDNHGQILILKRHPDKHMGGFWDIPGGKITKYESVTEALSREIFEETGLNIPPSALIFIAKTFIRYPEFDFISHVFYSRFSHKPENISISRREHTEYKWVKYKDIDRVPFVPDELERIQLYTNKSISD